MSGEWRKVSCAVRVNSTGNTPDALSDKASERYANTHKY